MIERDLRALDLASEPWMYVDGKVRPRSGRLFVDFARALRFQKRLGEGPADAHRLADGLHLCAEGSLCARELLEREAGELDHDIVECRLEARGRRSCEVVRDLVQRVADGQLRRDLGDQI